MKEMTLKSALGIFIVISHVLVLLLIITMFVRGWLLFDEMTTAIALVTPTLAAYSTAIIRFFIENQANLKRGKVLNSTTVFMSFFFPVVYIISAVGLLLLKTFNRFDSFEQFKNTYAALEAIFALYAGMIISWLFVPLEKERAKLPTNKKLAQ